MSAGSKAWREAVETRGRAQALIAARYSEDSHLDQLLADEPEPLQMVLTLHAFLQAHVVYTDPEETDGASLLLAMSRFAATAVVDAGLSLDAVSQAVEQYLSPEGSTDSHVPAAQILVLAALQFEHDPALLHVACRSMEEGYASVCRAILDCWLSVAMGAVLQQPRDVMWTYLGACAAVVTGLGEYAGCGADQLMKEYWLHLLLADEA